MSSPLYRTARWQRRRAWQLRHEPMCAFCTLFGRVTVATVADHIEPHRGDPAAFWANALQSLCATCHSGLKQRQEATGRLAGHDLAGEPIDPNHPWNRGAGSDQKSADPTDRPVPTVKQPFPFR